MGRPTILTKDSPKSRYHQDFPPDPHKWAGVCESAFGATKKDQAEIKKNWNKKVD